MDPNLIPVRYGDAARAQEGTWPGGRVTAVRHLTDHLFRTDLPATAKRLDVRGTGYVLEITRSRTGDPTAVPDPARPALFGASPATDEPGTPAALRFRARRLPSGTWEIDEFVDVRHDLAFSAWGDLVMDLDDLRPTARWHLLRARMPQIRHLLELTPPGWAAVQALSDGDLRDLGRSLGRRGYRLGAPTDEGSRRARLRDTHATSGSR